MSTYLEMQKTPHQNQKFHKRMKSNIAPNIAGILLRSVKLLLHAKQMLTETKCLCQIQQLVVL